MQTDRQTTKLRAATGGKMASGKADRTYDVSWLSGLAHQGLAVILSLTLLFQPMLANAQSVLADTAATPANRPAVGAARNGVPLIDIVTPTLEELSHNKYNQFNVGTPGLILNNHSGEAGTSLFGGVTPGNANLRTSGPATVILNDVTSGNRGHLLGPTEVFGGRAQRDYRQPELHYLRWMRFYQHAT